jgi:hypothetical protein
MMQDAAARKELAEAQAAGRFDIGYIYAGQSVGLLERRRPAREIVMEIGDGAERLLRERVSGLVG